MAHFSPIAEVENCLTNLLCEQDKENGINKALRGVTNVLERGGRRIAKGERDIEGGWREERERIGEGEREVGCIGDIITGITVFLFIKGKQANLLRGS